MNEIVFLKGKEIFTTSLAISEGVGLDHSSVFKMIKKYSYTEILLGFEIQKLSTKGRPIEVALLTELQSTFLITLMKNSSKVIEFKSSLTKAFFRQRKLLQNLLSQKENHEWLQERGNGKISRLQETDVIKKFVNYATDQGSSNALRYYGNITKMQNNALFFIKQKFDNLRDVMDVEQLNSIKVADKVIRDSLEESMELKLPYKECFQKAKEKVEALAAIIKKSSLPSLIENKQIEVQ